MEATNILKKSKNLMKIARMSTIVEGDSSVKSIQEYSELVPFRKLVQQALVEIDKDITDFKVVDSLIFKMQALVRLKHQ